MANIETYCGDCCFYNQNSGDCKQNLLQLFAKRNAKIDKKNMTIDRICQHKRSITWQDDKTDEERINLCNQEVYISGTIIILANNKENLEKTILKLNKNENIVKFKFIIIYFDMEYGDVFSICGNNIKRNYNLVHAIDKNINIHIHRSLSSARNGYLFILDSNKNFDHKMIDKINHFVNKKVFRLLHVPGTSDIHESVSMVHIYRWIKGDLQCSFRDKLIDISNQENSDPQIFTWEQINAEYSS